MKSRTIRKDIVARLDKKLDNSRVSALEHGASYPYSAKLSTSKTDYYVYEDKEDHKRYYNAVYYDGSRGHSERAV